ncbi:peroxisomal assembly protein [Malassezia equina]|uniref:Peroxisomal ATPase PEX6 n=1 Tax=Malassezia equina TaxID=1381935 RepID=A0AAF0EDI6_9BASI|nr:peroxisomal assembly protein [Malassezia equina]
MAPLVAARAYPIVGGSDDAWDTVYVNAALEDQLRAHEASAAPLAVSLASVEDAQATRTALGTAGRLVWARPAPPELEAAAKIGPQDYAVFVPHGRAELVALHPVEPVPLTAAYLAVAPSHYDTLAHAHETLLHAMNGRFLHTGRTCTWDHVPVRTVMTEPVAQGRVVAGTTQVYLLCDTAPPVTPTCDEEATAPLRISERFLARDPAPPLSLEARCVPSKHTVRETLRAWKQRGNHVYVDEESVVLVNEATLAELGIFDGDWAVASVLSESRARLVRVFASDAALRADEAFIPPMLSLNLVPAETHDPLRTLTLCLEPLPPHVTDEAASVADLRIAGSPAKPPLMPLAECMQLSLVATPISTDRAYEAQCMQALQAYLAEQPRILQEGDVLAVALVSGQARFHHIDAERTASLSEAAHADVASADLPGLAPTYWRHAVFYSVTALVPELLQPDEIQASLSTLPALRAWYMQLVASGSVANAGTWVDAAHTRITQAGTVQRRVPDVHAWLDLSSESPACPPDDTPLTEAGTPFARLVSLLHAALSPPAQPLGLHLTVLLTGAQGIGKRTLVRWAAQRTGAHLWELACPLLVGDSDAHTEGALLARCERARACAPCVLLLRDIDLLVRSNASEAAQGAIVRLLQRCLQPNDASPLFVVATAEEAERCPAALRGLFHESIELAPPAEPVRAQWLRMALAPYAVGADVDVPSLAVQTAALLAADLQGIVARAHVASVQRAARLGTTMSSVGASRPVISAADLDEALGQVRASYSESMGAPKIPNVTWDDVGGLASVKHEILDTVQLPLLHPELFSDGVKKRSGVLLYGPPGTGKTLLAKAVATTCALNFFSVKGPELLNMYIGESEANVRRVFQKARDARPCVIFFDELDSIAPKRGQQGDSGGVMDRIVSQLLAELDGMSSGAAASDVFVMGATNRPDLLDPALLRPGRFDRLLYLSVAETHEAQLHILQALTRKFTLDEDVSDLRVIAEQCPFHLTGADFYALCSDAMLKAMTAKAAEIDAAVARVDALPRTGARQHWPTPITPPFYLAELAEPHEVQVKVHRRHFEEALKELTPSVSPQEMAHYREVQRQFAQPAAPAPPSEIPSAPRPDKGKARARPS